MAKFDVISPDGFSISMDELWKSKAEAKKALKEWIKRYQKQGYYASVNGRIPLENLEKHCKIINL